jgi:DNA-binding protein H-NS
VAASSGTASKSKKSKSKLNQAAQFADGTGNEWVGRGPRPLWLREALAAGKSLSDFAVNRERMKTASKAKIAPTAQGKVATKPAKSKKNVIAIKYRDGDGNAWTGRGSQPRWLRTAIEGGKSLEQFLV